MNVLEEFKKGRFKTKKITPESEIDLSSTSAIKPADRVIKINVIPLSRLNCFWEDKISATIQAVKWFYQSLSLLLLLLLLYEVPVPGVNIWLVAVAQTDSYHKYKPAGKTTHASFVQQSISVAPNSKRS